MQLVNNIYFDKEISAFASTFALWFVVDSVSQVS